MLEDTRNIYFKLVKLYCKRKEKIGGNYEKEYDYNIDYYTCVIASSLQYKQS